MFALKSIQLKRIYEDPSPSDGVRILVDRLWPRGLSKTVAKVDHWFKEVAPSNELRKWYQHDPEKWKEFKKRYHAELKENREAVEGLLSVLKKAKKVTFLYSTKEEKLNNAKALKEYLIKN